MPVDVFDFEMFDEVVKGINPEGYHAGVVYGEHVWNVPVDAMTMVIVRSSIHVDGQSAGSGEDSIRLMLADRITGKPLGKVDTYTTRVNGWEQRLNVKVAYLTDLRMKAGDCRGCNSPLNIFLVQKDGPNHGRPFATCKVCGDILKQNFFWLDKVCFPYFAPRPEYVRVAVTEEIPVMVTETIQEVVTSSPAQAGGDFLNMLAVVDDEIQETPSNLLDDTDPDGVITFAPAAIEPVREPSEEQKQVISHQIGKPARVLAAPGSGKTFTMSYRYQAMLNSGIKPDEILVVTFSKRMATEISDRIMRLVPMVRGGAGERQICTIHAFCKRALVGYYPRWAKYTLPPSWLVKKTIEEKIALLEPDVEKRPAWQEVLGWIDSAKHHGCTMENDGEFFQNALGSHYGELLTKIRREFDTQMRATKEGYVTFADMLLDAEIGLFQDDGFRRYWQARIKHVILDEAQDTTAQAMRILSKLVEGTGSMMMVGDHDQLLFRFAGATPEYNLLNGFEERYPDGTTFFLNTNYRSTTTIVEMAQRSIAHNYIDLGGPYEQHYLKGSRSAPNAAAGATIELYGYESAAREAIGAVENIKRIMAETGATPGSFFVGFRTRAQAGYMEAALAKTDIPFINTTGQSFWNLSHVQDVISYLRLASNPNNRDAMAQVYNIASNDFTVPWKSHPDYGKYCNHRFLGKAFVEACGGKLDEVRKMYRYGSSSYNGKFAAGSEDLVELVDALSYQLDQCERRQEGLGSAVQAVLNLSYAKCMAFEDGSTEAGVSDGSKMDDLMTVVEVANDFTDINEFLTYVDRMIAMAKSQENGDWSGKVVLSTIHRLKGLERDYVLGIGISEFDETVERNPTIGLLPHTFSMIDPPQVGVLPASGKGPIEDERCLFFVLITRARLGVVLSSIRKYRSAVMRPSRFISELGITEL